MSEKYTLYLHICPNGKRYVGITCIKPEHRWNNGKGYSGCLRGAQNTCCGYHWAYYKEGD